MLIGVPYGSLVLTGESHATNIKKHIKIKQAQKSALIVLPKGHVPLSKRIKNIHKIILSYFDNTNLINFSTIAKDKNEKYASFLPLLHLSNEQQIYLWQPYCFSEISITKDMHPDEKKIIEKELVRQDI